MGGRPAGRGGEGGGGAGRWGKGRREEGRGLAGSDYEQGAMTCRYENVTIKLNILYANHKNFLKKESFPVSHPMLQQELFLFSLRVLF